MASNLRDYLRVKEAAEYIGISPSTLRNWERAGKIAAYRNPINGYRLFSRSELESLLKEVQQSRSGKNERSGNPDQSRI